MEETVKKAERCSIPNCNSENPEFKAPVKDPVMREMWEDALSQSGKLEINKTAFSRMKFCEKHFDENDIIRDLKSELLGLPIKRKLDPGAIPRFNLDISSTDKEKDGTSEKNPNQKMSKSGRIVKVRKNYDEEQIHEKKVKRSPQKSSKARKIKPPETNSIFGMCQKIQELKNELAKLRSERRQEESQDEAEKYVKEEAVETRNTPITAEEIRARYKEAVGMKVKEVDKHLLLKKESVKPSTSELQDLEKHADKLFYVKVEPSILLGTPELTAEYFVKQISDEASLKTISNCTKTELIQSLPENSVNLESNPNGLILFDKQAQHLWDIHAKSVSEVTQPLKKLHNDLTNESTTTIKRPRERFLSERKLQWLLPQLTKLKQQHNELRMYRRRELSRTATLKMARLKSQKRREKRKAWIQEQIRLGKLHKSALIWVNSNKLLPFEKEEKRLPTSTFSKSLSNEELFIEASDEDTLQFNDDIELNEAVNSIEKSIVRHSS